LIDANEEFRRDMEDFFFEIKEFYENGQVNSEFFLQKYL
jgi:hypothetical protein